MIYGSVCSGIEAATVAWKPLGWRAAFFSEIEEFPRAVLAHHYPDVPLHGDFTTIGAAEYEPIDLLVGGTPCQSFSVAGLRGGLADDRGNLALEFLKLAQRTRPKWLVWENVPGVLSSISHAAPDTCPPPPPMDMELDGQELETEDNYHSEELHAFNCFLAGLSELGYGFAYRVLDAQYVRVDGFGRAVPQRRRRVFVVGYLGDWRPAGSVLFDRESLSGSSAPRRQAWEDVAPTIAARTRGGGGLGTDFDCDGGLITSHDVAQTLLSKANLSHRADVETYICSHDPALTLTAREYKGALPEADLSTVVAHAIRGEGFDASEDGTGRGTPLIAFSSKDYGADATEDVSPTLRAMGHAESHPNAGGQIAIAQNILTNWRVRRLTPMECERLQGFPDEYTWVPGAGKGGWRDLDEDEDPDELREMGFPVRLKGNVWRVMDPDGPRYKAIGNSMPVNVMRWIGRRIQMVEDLLT